MPRKIPKALVLFAALAFFTEAAIGFFFSIYRYNPTNAKINAKIAIAKRNDLQNDLLIFAGSEGAVGIDAKLLGELTGLRCFNFSLIGDATLAGNYFLFEEYLQHNPPPKYLLLVTSYDTWARGFEYCGVPDTLTINFPLQTARYFGRSVLSRFLPSQRYRYEIRAFLRAENRGAYLTALMQKAPQMEDELVRQKGSTLFGEAMQEDIRKDLRDHESFVRTNNFFVSGLNRFGLEGFLRQAREQGIMVFVSFPPMMKEFAERYGNSPHINAYRSFILALPQRYPEVVLLGNDFFTVDAEYLSRTIEHLNTRGAKEFTRWLAAGILRRAGR